MQILVSCHSPSESAALGWGPGSLCFIYFYMFVFIFETERDRAWAGEGQRERETQNLKQVPGSEPSAQSPTRGSTPQTMRSRPELKSDA